MLGKRGADKMKLATITAIMILISTIASHADPLVQPKWKELPISPQHPRSDGMPVEPPKDARWYYLPGHPSFQRDAPTTRFYDSRGNVAGSASTYGNTTRFYDARGNSIGSSTTTGRR
jgi:YD repeat-containing protein